MVNTKWLEIMDFIYNKWICTYMDMFYWGELLAPTEYLFIKHQLEKTNSNADMRIVQTKEGRF